MSDDIVKQLRSLEAWIREPNSETFTLTADVFDDAAAEIERLRSALEKIEQSETRYANATVKRMAAIARAALSTPAPAHGRDMK